VGWFWWASFFLFIPSFAFSLVYCRCTKGRLTLLIKSVYYLSKKKEGGLGVRNVINFNQALLGK